MKQLRNSNSHILTAQLTGRTTSLLSHDLQAGASAQPAYSAAMNRPPRFRSAAFTLIYVSLVLALSSLVSAQTESSEQTIGESESSEQTTGESETSEQSTVTKDKIVVTASRIRGDEAGAIPVTTINIEEFTFSGASTVENVLNTMPQLVPSLTAASGSITEGDGTTTADLRGFGAQRTLVLVNGRRWSFADAQQVADLNSVPAALIERVDLVTGGSSAVHGSDAIAGVVNFVLREDFEGLELSFKGGQDFRTDGGNLEASIVAGSNVSDGRGNVTVALNYFDRNGIKASERGFSRESLIEVMDPNTGRTVLRPGGGSSAIPAGRVFGFPTGSGLANLPGLAAALENAGLGGVSPTGFLVEDGVQRPFNTNTDRFDFTPFDNIVIPLERYNITALFHYDLSDQFTFYSEANFTNSQVSIPIAPALVSQQMLVQTDNPFVTPELQALFAELDAIDNNPGDGLTAVSISRRQLENGPRITGHDRDSWKITAGVRGDLGSLSDLWLSDLAADVYYTFARTTNTLSRDGVLSRSRFNQAVLLNEDGTGCLDPSGGCVSINPFGANTLSPEAVDFLSVDGAGGDNEAELDVISGNINGNLVKLPAGWAGFAVGGEYRSASAKFVPDDFTATGDVAGFSAAAPATEGQVDVWEVFGELRVPVLADLPFAELLALHGAVRFSDYDIDAVDTVTTFFGGVDWQVTESLALRGQFQRAIRAPNLLELFAPVSNGIDTILDPCATEDAAMAGPLRDTCIATGVPSDIVGTPAVAGTNSIGTTIGGNPNLQEEEADTITLGLKWQPSFMPNLSVTVDYYDIELEDAISEFAGGAANAVSLCFNVIQNPDSPICRAINRDPTTGDISDSDIGVDVRNVNLSKIETSGIDFTLNYRQDLPWALIGANSALDFSLYGTYLDEFDTTPIPELPGEVNACAGSFGSICGEPLPEWKLTSRVTWRQGPLDISLRWRFLDAVNDDRVSISGVPAAEVANASVAAEHYFDLSGVWRMTDRFRIETGVLNLFDNSPPVTFNSNAANSRLNTYDGVGAQYFVRLAASF